MSRVIHFDIAADDPERAVRFYESAFGWTGRRWEGSMEYWLMTTGPGHKPGIDGGIGKRQGPSDHVMNTIGVDSLEKTLAKVVAAGGQVKMPRLPIPGVGWFAQCVDTEGNVFGLMQEDPKAK
jgi:uncharacterized protein